MQARQGCKKLPLLLVLLLLLLLLPMLPIFAAATFAAAWCCPGVAIPLPR